MPAFDPARDLRTLRELQDWIESLLDGAHPFETACAGVSAWSSLEHLAHVALANELVLRNLKSLAQGTGMLIVRGGEANPRALQLLEQGRLPRGQAQAPRMVRPPARVEGGRLRQWLADGRAALDALDPAEVVPGELKVPHQLLGPLDGPQWARFAVVHTRHHLEIVAEVLVALRPGLALAPLPVL